MYEATPVASRSSSSWTGSPVFAAETTTNVGARSSLGALSGPAASLSAVSASGPTTRKRHGFVRLCDGAQRASSNSSSSVSRGTGSGRKALNVLRVRIASSSSIDTVTPVFLGLLVFVVGMASLGAEIAGVRLLSPYFGASTVVWANTIGVVLVALAVGYWIGGRAAAKTPQPRPPRSFRAPAARPPAPVSFLPPPPLV